MTEWKWTKSTAEEKMKNINVHMRNVFAEIVWYILMKFSQELEKKER